MKSWIWLGVLSLTLGLSGCANMRVLNQPYKADDQQRVLIVYAANPEYLIETGRTGAGVPLYDNFDQWLFEAFNDSTAALKYYLFEPKAMFRFAARHNVKLETHYYLTTNGLGTWSQPIYTFSDKSMKNIYAMAYELGASHVIKVKILGFVKNNYYRTQGTIQGNFTRVDAAFQVTAYDVERPKPLFKKTFKVWEDKSDLLGFLMGGGNVKSTLVSAIINEIESTESR